MVALKVNVKNKLSGVDVSLDIWNEQYLTSQLNIQNSKFTFLKINLVNGTILKTVFKIDINISIFCIIEKNRFLVPS